MYVTSITKQYNFIQSLTENVNLPYFAAFKHLLSCCVGLGSLSGFIVVVSPNPLYIRCIRDLGVVKDPPLRHKPERQNSELNYESEVGYLLPDFLHSERKQIEGQYQVFMLMLWIHLNNTGVVCTCDKGDNT